MFVQQSIDSSARPAIIGVAIGFLILFCGFQTVQSQQSIVPTITYTCDFPGSDPAHYVISVAKDGHAFYASNGKLTPDSEASDPTPFEFTLSPATTSRIFDLAKRAHYFEGELDSKRKNIAFTGTKVLTYKDEQKNTRGSYNFSLNPDVQALTTLFSNLSNTMEARTRLEYYLHYQKLALDDELKRLEEMSKQGDLEELSAISPTLQKIVDNPSLLNVVRARAQRLLAATAGRK
jgi:hypothetical protein